MKSHLAKSFDNHAKSATCVWERSSKGWYRRDVTAEDKKGWKQISEKYEASTQNSVEIQDDSDED